MANGTPGLFRRLAGHGLDLTTLVGRDPWRLRPEAFGYIVLGASLVPVTAEARPLLEACDGSITLRQIEERYGPEGLELIVDLYRKGLVEM